MDGIVATIRSALISTKGKCDLRTLQKDYQMLMGTDIPYRNLGYNRLEEFLRDCPTLAVSNGPNGQILVDAITTDKSSHIASLVNRQKTTTKKRTKIAYRRGPPQRQPRYSTQANWRPASTGKKWQPSYQASARPAAVAHNQIVSWNHQRTTPETQPQNLKITNNTVTSRLEPPRRGRPVSHSVAHSAIPSPRSRAGIAARSYSEDSASSSSSYKKSPSPPPIFEIPEIEKSFTSRIRRTISNPINGITALQRTAENRLRGVDLSCARPRMRTHSSYTGPPSFTSPTTPTAIQFTSPQLTATQIEELKQTALAAVDPSSSVWNWSSSDESTPRGRANSGDSTPDKVESPSPRSSTIMELKAFVAKHNLGEPLIKIAKRKSKNYDCKIKIGPHMYSSYPDDFSTPDAAQLAATSIALNDLKQKYAKSEQLFISTDKDILERIPPIIIKHFHGVWAKQIELDYEDTYKEQLPQNWLALLDTLPTISVEQSIENKYVLRHCKIGEKNKAGKNIPLASDVSVPSNTVKVNEDGCVVQVTCALSTVEVWCRELFTEEADKYDKMCKNMDEYYSRIEEHASHINTGGFYVVYYDDIWCRVRALNVHDKDVMCFFIDYGDEYLVPKSDIYMLHRQFARQQAQAFVCRLAGLEELVNVTCASKHLEQITGKEYLAQPIQVAQTDEDKELDPILTIVLYETSGVDDININQELIKLITLDSAVSNLEKDGINKVYVSHADQNGNVYVQPHSEGYDKFMDLMNDLEGINFETEVPNVATEPEKLEVSSQLYLTKWSEDDRYYRCKILDFSPDKNYAQIYFVDYGNEQIIKIENSKLYPLELISDVLCLFPYQAVKVKINIEPEMLPENFVTKLLELLPNEQGTLLKILRTENEIHYCDFFKRSTDNILFSVNSSLQLEHELPGDPSEDGNNNDRSNNLMKKLQRLKSINQLEKPVPSTGLLKAPRLPDLNDWFEVKVPCAVNPWNFFVQPYTMGQKLKELMSELQEKYKVVTHSPIQIEDVIPGRIYASKHEDGFWYRTSVIKVIHTGSISVFYCDFGYYANLKIFQLVPLDEKFMDLPYQAIKAKLAGIKPKNVKWSMDDCKYFEQLVCKKTFVSILQDIQKDELYKYDLVLSLKLIDTSSTTDIALDQLLIERGIAIADTSKKEQRRPEWLKKLLQNFDKNPEETENVDECAET